MSRKPEFLLAVITVIFMIVYFVTDVFIFAQIGATVALVNLLVSTIRETSQHSKEDREK